MRRVSAGRRNPELVEQAERQETTEAALASPGQSNDILNGMHYGEAQFGHMQAECNLNYSRDRHHKIISAATFHAFVINIANEFTTFHRQKKNL